MHEVYDLRHTRTRYCHLVAFYNIQHESLNELHNVCANFLDGLIGEEEFKAKVEKIESEVDLTIKANQKKYKNDIVEKILASGGAGEKAARRTAEDTLRNVLKRHQHFTTTMKRKHAQRGGN